MIVFVLLFMFVRSFFLQVCKHLAKLFDNMSTLEFTKNEDGEATKRAVGMYSKENEYVPFKEPFMCTGQV